MLLKEILSNPIKAFVHLERYVNDGSPSGFSEKNIVTEPYSPTKGSPTFNLPIIWFPFENVTTIGSVRHLNFGRKDSPCSPFPVHPDLYPEWEQLLHEVPGTSLGMIEVAPTASGRTVIAGINEGVPFFIKLHYPGLIGRFHRDITLYKWLPEIENSRELARLFFNNKMWGSFLPSLGGVYSERAKHRGGVVFRSFTEYPSTVWKGFMIPSFSLWSIDRIRPQDPTLLAQLQAETGLNFQSMIEYLFVPLFQSYAELAINCGLIPEDNAQNILFKFSSDFSMLRVVRRDMMGFFKDNELRGENVMGLFPLTTYHELEPGVHDDIRKRRSFAYDFKFSRYVIDPLANQVAHIFKVSLDHVANIVKKLAIDIVIWPSGYFEAGQKAYGYDNILGVSRSSYREIYPFLYR